MKHLKSYKLFESEDNETICSLCNKPLDKEDSVYLEFINDYVHKHCFIKFNKNDKKVSTKSLSDGDGYKWKPTYNALSPAPVNDITIRKIDI